MLKHLYWNCIQGLLPDCLPQPVCFSLPSTPVISAPLLKDYSVTVSPLRSKPLQDYAQVLGKDAIWKSLLYFITLSKDLFFVLELRHLCVYQGHIMGKTYHTCQFYIIAKGTHSLAPISHWATFFLRPFHWSREHAHCLFDMRLLDSDGFPTRIWA